MKRRRFLSISSQSALALPVAMTPLKYAFAKPDEWQRVLSGAASKFSKTLRVLYPKGCLANLQPVIKEFTAASGVQVVPQETDLDTIAETMSRSTFLDGSKSSFDIALPPTFSIPNLVDAGVVRALDDLSNKYKKLSQFPSLYTLGDAYDDKLYGYQTDGDVYLLFLRRSWLENPDHQKQYQDKFGRKLEVPRTWEELDRQMAFFHDPNNGRYGGCLFRHKDYAHWEYWIRLHGQGVYPFDNQLNPQISKPAGLNALDQLKKATPYLHPSVTKNGLFENFEEYAKGHSYANLGWGGSQKYFRSPKSKIKNDLIIVKPPGGRFGSRDISMSYFNWGWNYVVHSKSQNPELAYLFCLFATSPKISKLAVAENGYFDPFRLEHFDHKPIVDAYGKDFLDTQKAALAGAIPDLYLKGQGHYLYALKQAIHLTVSRHVSAAAAMKSADNKWLQLSKKVGVDYQLKQWHHLQSKYPPELRKVLKG